MIVGRDTRKSGPLLSTATIDGVADSNGTFIDLGIVTTPQLHFVVRCTNDPSYGTPTVEGYNKKLSEAFVKLMSFAPDATRTQLTVNIMWVLLLMLRHGCCGYVVLTRASPSTA